MGYSTAAEIVVLRNPALSGDSRLSDMIELSKLELSEDVYGDQYENAVALLTLHKYAIGSRGGGGPAGAIASEAEGRLSRSFNSSGGTHRQIEWASTSWGQELIQLTESLVVFFRNRRYP
jgi:hypothetical protein